MVGAVFLLAPFATDIICKLKIPPSPVRLGVLLLAAALLTYGWLAIDSSSALTGAIIFVVIEAVSLLDLFRIKRLYARGELNSENEQPTRLDIIAIFVQGSMTVSSLIGIVIAKSAQYSSLAISAWIVWLGSIALYVAGGFIVSVFIGIPLKMTYGGWRSR